MELLAVILFAFVAFVAVFVLLLIFAVVAH